MQATEKIQGGKLLTVKVEIDKKIRKVHILGDFFAHPEYSISEIENKFTNLEIDFNEIKMTKEIENMLAKRGYELIGIDAASIVRLIKRALE